MTRWGNLSREDAKQLGIEGEYELMEMEQQEKEKTATKSQPEVPYEEKEQKKLAEYLDMKGYCWIHVPNGGARNPIVGAKMKAQGVKKGFPDVQIFDVPEDAPDFVRGIVIELKRQKGGRLRDSQKKWLQKLNDRKWLTNVCHGADEAIGWLENLFD